MDLIKTLTAQYMKPELPAMRVGDPVHSPTIVSVGTVRRGKVRRAKLYYLRDRVGKRAKVKELI